MMFAAVYQESYRYAEARARRIVEQRDNRTLATTASLTEWSTSTSPYSPSPRRSPTVVVDNRNGQERPPRRIILNRLDSNASTASSVYADDSARQEPTTSATTDDACARLAEGPLQMKARQVENAIADAIVRFEQVETDLLKEHNDGDDTLLDQIARRIDHLEERLCDLSSARRQNLNDVRSILQEFATLDAGKEIATWMRKDGPPHGQGPPPPPSINKQQQSKQLSPIIEPQPVDPEIVSIVDEDGTSFSI